MAAYLSCMSVVCQRLTATTTTYRSVVLHFVRPSITASPRVWCFLRVHMAAIHGFKPPSGLFNVSTTPHWRSRPDLNRRPLPYQGSALPTEPRDHTVNRHHFTSASGGRALTWRLTNRLPPSLGQRQLFQPRESIGIVGFSGGERGI